MTYRNPPWWPQARLHLCCTDSDAPCPMGCGGRTEDPLGGPCPKCSDALDEPEET